MNNAVIDMSTPNINNKTYINRELSWIDFNKRVLEFAIEEETPLLEKIKWLFLNFLNNNTFPKRPEYSKHSFIKKFSSYCIDFFTNIIFF